MGENILIRCGFGGFGESICLAIYATCLQLVDACQSSQRKALLSHLTWRSKKRERRGNCRGRGGVSGLVCLRVGVMR